MTGAHHNTDSARHRQHILFIRFSLVHSLLAFSSSSDDTAECHLGTAYSCFFKFKTLKCVRAYYCWYLHFYWNPQPQTDWKRFTAESDQGGNLEIWGPYWTLFKKSGLAECLYYISFMKLFQLPSSLLSGLSTTLDGCDCHVKHT